ncbi:G-protein coupled receptor 157-like [Saccostrea echinata]|uniref:G-protein coupled receptor 157-like n=1 Tax=Saccostrea echinata TaxID=191078 RepID=UPI002A83A748|nr:G-protein coupled receptor 157-like [Saccostrea echinata]
MEDRENISVITLVSCFASLLGGVGLLMTQYKMENLHYMLRNLLSFLTIADIITVLGYICGTFNYMYSHDEDTRNTTLCEAQSFVTTFSNMSSFAWTSIITVHLFLLVRTTNDWDRNTCLKVLYHVIGWFIPGFITVVMLVTERLGESYNITTGPWCWIKLNQTNGSDIQLIDKEVMLLAGKLWEFLTYILSLGVFMHLKITAYIERETKQTYRWSRMVMNPASLRREDERFCYIWLPLYLLRFWGTLRFFMVISNSNELQNGPNYLLYLQCVGDSSHALGNFILFCLLDKEIRGKYMSVCFRRFENQEEQEENPTLSAHYQSIGSS